MNPIYKRCFVRMILFFGYGLLGSWLFCLIEKREESYAVTSKRLLGNLRKEMMNRYNITNSTDFDKFVKTASKATLLKGKLDWTVLNGCGFTFPAITTVGYGSITPRTALGQILTIPFCLIGLPITMMTLKTAGEIIVIGMKTITALIERKILGRQNPKQKTMKCLLVVIFCICLVICILATAGIYMEGWTFTEGVYCWFITFTTIGFGDYVPFKQFQVDKINESNWILIVTGIIITVPYIVGLCLVSGLLNLLVDYSDNIKIHFHNLSFCTVCRTCSCILKSETSISYPGETIAIGNNVTLESVGSRRFSV